MGKFVYKIIQFLLMLPINIVKYFFMGLYFVCSTLIEIMLNTVFFVSFLVYKIVKYLVLFFAFPILVFNLFRRTIKGDRQEDEMTEIKDSELLINTIEPIVLAESNEDLVNNIDDEPLVVDNILEESFIEKEMITPQVDISPEDEIVYIDEQVVEPIKTENIAEVIPLTKPKKVRKPLNPTKILKSIFLPFEIVSYPIYKIFKYLILSIIYTFKTIYQLFKYLILGFVYITKILCQMFKYIIFGIIFTSFGVYKLSKSIVKLLPKSISLIGNGLLTVCFYVYKLFKYLVYSFGLPVLIANMILTANREKILNKKKIREIKKIKKAELKLKKQLENQKKIEDKLRSDIKRKKKQDEYINENVKIQKKTLKEQFNEFLNVLFNFPKMLIDKIKNSIHNSVFMKNSRNRQDINRQALLISFEGEDAEKSDVKLVYQYIAKNQNGKVITDYMEAFSKVEVHSFLLSEGFEVYSIKTNKWIQLLHQNSAESRIKMKNKDLIFFLTQLSTYLKAGITLVESLKILARQYGKNKRYQQLFRTVIYDLSMGDSFSAALAKRGNAFPKILVNMVKSSEMTGELPEVLDDMAEYFTEMDKTRKQMVTALMYPMIILVVSVVVVVFILLFVIPKFVDIYKSMDAAKIPKFTLAVLAVSDFLKNYTLYLVIGIVVFIVLYIYLYKNVKVFRTLSQWIFMHIPVFKNVIIYNEVTNFTKTFASLLSHNVYITDSMEILTRITNNEIYKMLILDTITNLAKGEKISASFKDHWAFPIPAYEMLVTGEQTGQLPEMMAKVSDYYQDLHKNTVTRLKTFIEPILIIFLTVVVGVIVLSIIIPMFGMYQTVQGFQ